MKKTEKNKGDYIKISLGNLLLGILVLLIITTGTLMFVIKVMLKDNSKEEVSNIVENVVVENVVSSEEANVEEKKEDEIIVLYDGLILDTTKMGKKELKYIENKDKYKDKYIVTYYNYEKFGFKESKLGVLSEEIFENLLKVDNVSKISISKNYEAIPREIKISNEIPTSISENDIKQKEFDSKKVIIADLDGNETEEYIIILANRVTGYSKIMLMDSTGVKVADLAYSERSEGEIDIQEEYYLSLDSVEVLDIDNDEIMEIIIEIPNYEGEPDISLLKYENGELLGDTNIKCSMLP